MIVEILFLLKSIDKRSRCLMNLVSYSIFLIEKLNLFTFLMMIGVAFRGLFQFVCIYKQRRSNVVCCLEGIY